MTTRPNGASAGTELGLRLKAPGPAPSLPEPPEPMPWARDRQGRALLGPMPLGPALAAAEPSETGVRVAISCYDGDLVAVQMGGRVEIRRLLARTGQGGSIGGTGEWRTEKHAHLHQWRPG